MNNMAIYDSQIAHLKANPEKINAEWGKATGIFGLREVSATNGMRTMCVTMIRNHRDKLINPAPIVVELSKDERLPAVVGRLTVNHLDLIAAYNVRMDEAGISKVVTNGL